MSADMRYVGSILHPMCLSINCSRWSLATPSEAANNWQRGLWHPGMENDSPGRPTVGALPYASHAFFMEDDR